jgi:hypothetical protein
MSARTLPPRGHKDVHATIRRLDAEVRVAAVQRAHTRRAVAETVSRLKDEVARQIAQIEDDRAHAVRPTHQIPNNWRCVHFETPVILYKVVACVNDAFVSVYDGKTTYELGRRYQSRRGSGWPPLNECFFAFGTPAGALQAGFPSRSIAKHHPRVLLKIEALGNAYECCNHVRFQGNQTQKGTGKMAVTEFKAVRVMTDAFRASALEKLRFPDAMDPGSGLRS